MDLFTPDDVKNDAGAEVPRPLADRMRPATLDEFVGQDSVVGKGTPLRKAIESDNIGSIILWGPPGTGKTTLAELIAVTTRGQFIPFSAVSSSIKEIKEIISKAGQYYRATRRRTYIFVDEIHRFNKAQQDAFLPYVEKGDIVLIGATTENPSFEVNSALLSRMRVYVLNRLGEEEIKIITVRALQDSERGLGSWRLLLEDDALDFIAAASDGDARRALVLLELAADFVGQNATITVSSLEQVNQRSVLLYDKAGEEHFNIISALHKTIRGGDPDAALYWLCRMLDSGEDPLYVVRRLIRFATEDIGLADPYALTLALNAKETHHFLGSPEGELAIAEAVVYMACAPKSNAVYLAYGKARKDAHEKGSLPVPLWIRNAPTKLMGALGYGKDYKYAHDFEDAITDQEYFPAGLEGSQYYEPTARGREEKLHEYLQRYREMRRKLLQSPEKKKTGKG